MMTDGGLAAAVRHAREAAHLTQAELAARADMSVQTVSRLERGQGVAEESVRSVAAALGIDSATLPRRPGRDAMPDSGGTDPHWRDFLSAVREAGEHVVAAEHADAARYAAEAEGRLPPDRPVLREYGEPIQAALGGAIPGIVLWAFTLFAWVSTGHGQPPDALALPVLFSFALPAVAWAVWAKRTVAPVAAARDASARLAARLAGERYVVTDRAVYAVASRADGCTWERIALDGARCRREPLDAYAPGMSSLVVRGASGRAVRLSALVPGGKVAASLDALVA